MGNCYTHWVVINFVQSRVGFSILDLQTYKEWQLFKKLQAERQQQEEGYSRQLSIYFCPFSQLPIVKLPW